MVNNNNVKIMLTLNDKKRFTAFVQLLITIDRRADQARDKNGRYASSKQEDKQIKSKPSPLKARKKSYSAKATKDSSGPFLLQPFHTQIIIELSIPEQFYATMHIFVVLQEKQHALG